MSEDEAEFESDVRDVDLDPTFLQQVIVSKRSKRDERQKLLIIFSSDHTLHWFSGQNLVRSISRISEKCSNSLNF